MKRRITPLFFVVGFLAFIVSSAHPSVAEESASQAPKRFKTPREVAIYNDSQPALGQDLQLLREEIRSQKKQIVAANMTFTDAEAEKFWPVYDRYAADFATIYDAKLALIQEYLNTRKTMTGDEAERYIRRRAGIEEDVMDLRLRYLPEFRKVLSGRQAALFFQIDWRLDLLINLQLAKTPLLDP